jgi:hypothetical protein
MIIFRSHLRSTPGTENKMDNQKTSISNHKLIFIFLKSFLLCFIYLSDGYAADNPCGVSCTQTIADSAINMRVYEKIVIFSENNSNIAPPNNNQWNNQWAFGDGGTGVIGIPVAEDWEIYAVSLQASSVTATSNSTTSTTVKVHVLNQNTTPATVLYTISARLDTQAIPPISRKLFYTDNLLVPVAVSKETTLGFATQSVSQGTTVTGARVAVFLRRHPD